MSQDSYFESVKYTKEFVQACTIPFVLSKFCFITEEDEVVFDYRFYKPLLPVFEETVNHTKCIFYELRRRQMERLEKGLPIQNILHINVNYINIVKLEKYSTSIRKFMVELMNEFPDYELTKCYAYNASLIFTVMKQIAASVYGHKLINNKIEIV
jgi:hypothetical protein